MTPSQSSSTQSAPARVTLRLTGPPLTVGPHTLQPVAHLRGWKIGVAEANASGGGAWLRLTPVAVQVTTAGAAPYTVPISAPSQRELWEVAVAALAIAAGFGALNLLLRRWFG